jgi:hypothetical protein
MLGAKNGRKRALAKPRSCITNGVATTSRRKPTHETVRRAKNSRELQKMSASAVGEEERPKTPQTLGVLTRNADRVGRRLSLAAFPGGVSGEDRVAPQAVRHANKSLRTVLRLQLVLRREAAMAKEVDGKRLGEAREWGASDRVVLWPAGRTASRACGRCAARFASPGPAPVLGPSSSIGEMASHIPARGEDERKADAPIEEGARPKARPTVAILEHQDLAPIGHECRHGPARSGVDTAPSGTVSYRSPRRRLIWSLFSGVANQIPSESSPST